MKYKYFTYDLDQYPKPAIQDLEKGLSDLGFKKTTPELGAGPSVEQIVSWLVIISKDLSVNVISTIIASKLERALSQLFSWHKNHENHNSKRKPAVIVNIFFEKDSKLKSMTFKIDGNNSREEIEIEINKTKGVEVIRSGTGKLHKL